MSKKSAAGLVAWAEQAYKNGWVYWYGTCGYACSKSLLTSKTKQYPSHYRDSRQATYKKHIAAGKVCSDCIGLFKSYAWDKDGSIDTRANGYQTNAHPDCSASMAKNSCTVKGDIDTIPEIPGLAVWNASGSHVGVYVGGGYVIEARGFAYGTQRNKLSSREFTVWGLYPYVEYTEEQVAIAKAAVNANREEKTVTIELKQLRKGSKGNQVKTLQRLLKSYGYGGSVDGDFGTMTEERVKKYQKAKGLTADGIVGQKTWTKLLG